MGLNKEITEEKLNNYFKRTEEAIKISFESMS